MTFSAFLPYVIPHRRVLATIVFLMLAGSVTSLAQPWLAGQLTEALLDELGAWDAKDILITWLILLIVRSALDFASQFYIGGTGENITADLRSRLFQHLQALPIAYYHQRRRGDVLAMLSNDAEQISDFVTHTLVQLLPLLFTLAGAFLAMLWIDPVIAMLSVCFLPAYFLMVKVIGKRIRPLSRSWIEAYSRLVSFFSEHLEMKPAIKSFAREAIEDSQFETHNKRLLSLSRQQLLVQSLISPTIGLLAGMGLLLLFWLGSARVESGFLTPAELVSLLLYAMLMSQPLRSLSNVYGEIQRARGAAERILEFFAVQAEPSDADCDDMPASVGEIRFEGVSFRYNESRPVLEKFNLEIAAGETIAVTGPNGAGKSTLSYLLQRMADPDEGRILIDGRDLKSTTLASLRRQFGVVAQHTLLVNGTISENIAYGRPWAEEEEVVAAARKAHAHDFIDGLQEGYDTVIGDQGLRLSGGQRQRIALARALLIDPPILILDEATSMFDPAGEESFIEECKDLLASKTVLLITHRTASLSLADRVIELLPPTTLSHGDRTPFPNRVS
ncbi:MAG: ABC transporter ATP-binding protein [Halioglobus sp.]